MKELYHGKESFLSQREAKKVIKELNTNNEYELVTLNCDILSPEQIVNSISTEDIFSKNKIFLIKRFYQNKQKEELVKYLISMFDSLSKSNHYIFWEDGKVSSITKYYKLFGKNIREFDEIKKISFIKWAGEEIKKYNIKITRENLNKLCNNVNYQIERLINEIEKYSILEKEEITSEDIDENTTDTYESDIWKMIEFINSKDTSKALYTLQNLISHEQEPLFIFAMIIRNLRLITQVKYMYENNNSSKEICSTLKIAPFMLPELLSVAKSQDWKKIKFLYEKFSGLDYEIKRGNIDPQLGLTLLISKIN